MDLPNINLKNVKSVSVRTETEDAAHNTEGVADFRVCDKCGLERDRDGFCKYGCDDYS